MAAGLGWRRLHGSEAKPITPAGSSTSSSNSMPYTLGASAPGSRRQFNLNGRHDFFAQGHVHLAHHGIAGRRAGASLGIVVAKPDCHLLMAAALPDRAALEKRHPSRRRQFVIQIVEAHVSVALSAWGQALSEDPVGDTENLSGFDFDQQGGGTAAQLLGVLVRLTMRRHC